MPVPVPISSTVFAFEINGSHQSGAAAGGIVFASTESSLGFKFKHHGLRGIRREFNPRRF
jgi:hypothetical protein